MFVKEQNIKYGNTLLEKSFSFSVRIVKFYKFQAQKNNVVLSLINQLLRSGTSIGANVSEAQCSISKKEFISKLQIALKEAKETEYWIKLFKESGDISNAEFESLNNDCEELLKLLVSILKTLKSNNS
ncbi:MAG: four helix bundle protein [Ignavibacteria bacterium]|nr:four helix bundle protein [Ignavibacteria bacterium]